ncbi:MAG: hypothetical protein GY941_19840 [Planctomycetes bacterium]|nr:hypothetical protein [Planctomycetota bacterium]
MHERQAAAATRLIAKHGRVIIIRVKTEDDPNDWQTTSTSVDHSVIGVQTQFKTADIDGEMIRSKDKRFLIDGVVEINESMTLIEDGLEYDIINAELVQPGTRSILYKVQARR